MSKYEELLELVLEHGGAHRRVYDTFGGKNYEKNFDKRHEYIRNNEGKNLHQFWSKTQEISGENLDKLNSHVPDPIKSADLDEAIEDRARAISNKRNYTKDNLNKRTQTLKKAIVDAGDSKEKSDVTKKLDKKLHRVKESVDDIKLEIYEACYNGEISKEERDILLSNIG